MKSVFSFRRLASMLACVMNISLATPARLCVFGAWILVGASLPSLAAPTAHAQPAANRVLQLDGTNSYVQLPANLLANLDAVTIEMWVRAEELREMHFIQFGLPPNELYLGLPQGGDALKLPHTDGGGNRLRIPTGGLMKSNRRVHVGAVLSGTGSKLYCDGTMVGSEAVPVLLEVIEPTDNTPARYRVTRLEQGIEVLEKDGETGKTIATHLRQQIRAGDLDAVSSFLEKVKEQA